MPQVHIEQPERGEGHDRIEPWRTPASTEQLTTPDPLDRHSGTRDRQAERMEDGQAHDEIAILIGWVIGGHDGIGGGGSAKAR